MKKFINQKVLKHSPVTSRKTHRIPCPKDLLQNFSKHFHLFKSNFPKTNRQSVLHLLPHETLPHTKELSALCVHGTCELTRFSSLAESEKAMCSKHSMPTYSSMTSLHTPTPHQNSYPPPEYRIRNEKCLQQNRCRLFLCVVNFFGDFSYFIKINFIIINRYDALLAVFSECKNIVSFKILKTVSYHI